MDSWHPCLYRHPESRAARPARCDAPGARCSCLLALGVAAIQILPVLDQIATSVRWAGSGPTLLYDTSLLPYRVFEFVWPNVFGSFWAGNRYWMALLPPSGAHRPWPLSLYVGMLPLVLAVPRRRVASGKALPGRAG